MYDQKLLQKAYESSCNQVAEQNPAIVLHAACCPFISLNPTSPSASQLYLGNLLIGPSPSMLENINGKEATNG